MGEGIDTNPGDRPTTGAVAPPQTRALRRLRAFARGALRFVLLGAVVNVAVAFALALLVDVSKGLTTSAQAWTGHDVWNVTCWTRPGAAYFLSSREGARQWSPRQACGVPDALQGGDQVTAWASATQDGQPEWLVLEYPEPVVPRAVRVYETCGTGALVQVGVFTESGEEVVGWKGVDPTPQGGRVGVSQVPVSVDVKTKKVKLYLDSVRVPNWNEIDAVALVGSDGREQWAVAAEASSVYGVSVAATSDYGGVTSMAPAWSGLDQPPPLDPLAPGRGSAAAVEARGWPMLTLWAKTETTAASAQSSAASGFTPVSFGGGSGLNTLAFTSSGRLLSRPGLGASSPGAPVSGRAALPLRPIWDGFLINAGFYAVVLFLLHWAMTRPIRFVREVSRLRRGGCVACGYDLGFDFIHGCPECGWRRGVQARS